MRLGSGSWLRPGNLSEHALQLCLAHAESLDGRKLLVYNAGAERGIGLDRIPRHESRIADLVEPILPPRVCDGGELKLRRSYVVGIDNPVCIERRASCVEVGAAGTRLFSPEVVGQVEVGVA